MVHNKKDMQELTYKYYRKRGTKTVFMILHGGGPVGVETDFISSIFDAIAATKNSVLCFNFRIAREKKRLRAAQN